MAKQRVSLSENYYNGREVQRLLGINEPKLRTLVANKQLTKVYPPGRKTALYSKREVNNFAERWEAFVLAKEPPKVSFHIAQEADMEAENELDRRAIGGAGMTTEIRKSWLSKNAECDYHVKYGDKLVALLRLLPLKHATIMATMEDKIKGVEIPASDVEPFETGKSFDLYVISICSDPDVDEETRMHYMLVLIRGVAKELEALGKRGIILRRVYAKAQTPRAVSMAIHIGMEEMRELRNKKTTKFFLEIDKSDSFLAQSYKAGFMEWEKAQRKKPVKQSQKA